MSIEIFICYWLQFHELDSSFFQLKHFKCLIEKYLPEAYLGHCKTSIMSFFAKIITVVHHQCLTRSNTRFCIYLYRCRNHKWTCKLSSSNTARSLQCSAPLLSLQHKSACRDKLQNNSENVEYWKKQQQILSETVMNVRHIVINVCSKQPWKVLREKCPKNLRIWTLFTQWGVL